MGLAIGSGRARETMIFGTVRGRSVRAVLTHDPTGFERLTIEVEADRAIAADLRLVMDLRFGTVIDGSDELGLALFDATIRELRLFPRNQETPNGTIGLVDRSIRIEHYGSVDLETVADLVARSVAIAERTRSVPNGIPAVLYDTAFEKGLEDVRERSMRMLLVRYPKSVEAERAIERGLAEDNLRLRFLAASLAGERGDPVVQEIVFSDFAPDDIKKTALAHLVGRFDRAAATALLARVLEAPFQGVLHTEAVHHLTEVQGENAGRVLVDLVPRVFGVGARAIAVQLAAYPIEEVERCLLRLIEERDEETSAAAAGALRQIGTSVSIPVLRSVVDRRFASTELRDVARQAIRAIRGRIPATDVGQLALAAPDGDEGHLSVADEGGGLSAIEDPE
jgi:hypothetical protein